MAGLDRRGTIASTRAQALNADDAELEAHIQCIEHIRFMTCRFRSAEAVVGAGANELKWRSIDGQDP
ncbi:hypothetical protein GX51_06598 [Blastomyces parvus]|uniref:Uncharacterized protein n=1 Tax=Blastomyces parvus TaxID=2060905 RepID=A0A2B7WQA1_9EURO|nr:hypothetical protein GX51_06598 [Blastomyces parvus]